MAEQVDQFQIRVVERGGRQTAAFQGDEPAALRREARIPEIQRRQFLPGLSQVVVTDDIHLGQQGDAIGWQFPGREDLVQIAERIGPDLDRPVCGRMGAHQDGCAASAGADFKAGAVLGKGVRAVLVVLEGDGDEELTRTVCVIIVDVTDGFKIELVEESWAISGLVAFVCVFDAIAERVFGGGQAPGEDPRLIHCRRIGDDGRIGMPGIGRAVITDQPILAAYLPVVGIPASVVGDQREQTFGAGAVADVAVAGLDRNQVLGAGEHEDVRLFWGVVAVLRNALRGEPGHAGNAQTPAQTERPVTAAGAVAEGERWLEAVTPGWQRNGDGKVAGTCVKVGRKLFSQPFQGSSAFGYGNKFRRRTRLGTQVTYLDSAR